MLAKRQNALGLALPDGIAAGDDHLQPCGVKRHEPERQPGEQARAAQEHQPGDQVLHSRRWLGDALSDARIARSAVDIARAAFTHHRLRLRADGRTTTARSSSRGRLCNYPRSEDMGAGRPTRPSSATGRRWSPQMVLPDAEALMKLRPLPCGGVGSTLHARVASQRSAAFWLRRSGDGARSRKTSTSI